MDRFSPWVPMIIVLITIPIVFVMILFIPETLTVNVKKQTTEHQPPLVALRNHIAHGFKDLRNSLRMLCNINIPLCLITFFFNSARFTAGSSTLAQYISKNFGWTLAETSVLLSPLGVIHLIVLASLPKLSEVLMSSRFGFTTFDKDVFLARTCLLILTVSALIRAFSSSIGPFLFGLFVGSFGAAENPLIRSIMSNFVEPSYISRLYALVSITEVLGSFAGPPVLAWCFDKGMKLKGTWAGLPWFYLAFVCFLSWLGMVFVRAPKKNWYDNEVFGADEGDEIAPSNPVRLE